MGSHRADVDTVGTERLSPPSGTPYVGKRAARYVPEAREAAPAQSTTPYVGRRALRTNAPREVDQVAPATPSAAAVTTFALPTPRRSAEWELFAAESPEDTGALPYALTDDFTGSLPKITDEMLYGAPGTDLSQDTTVNLPAVLPGKRRAATRTRSPLLRGIPSLPAMIGVAVLAVAGFGAIHSGGTELVKADAGPLRQAGALSGTSAVGVVGSARAAGLSRSDDRTDAESVAANRTAAINSTNTKIAAQSDKLKLNQWGLPITPGVYHLTARFGDSSGLWSHRHTGLDFACPTGTPIHAVANGVITSTGYDGAYGNKTVETLDDGTELWYAHQVRFGTTPGTYVHTGEIIGYVGSTGNVTGPHVHLEVRPGGGDPVDPFTALVAQGLTP